MNPAGDTPGREVQARRSFRLRFLRGISPALMIAGFVFLCLHFLNRDRPDVKTGDITPAMNFTRVRITGEVARNAFILKTGGVVFDVRDESGQIAVTGGRAQARTLEERGNLPRRGDRVEVSGILSVNAGQTPTLRIQSADHLVLNRRKVSGSNSVPCTALSSVTAAQSGQRLAVTGTLKSVSLPGPGSKAPYVLTLENGGAKLAVVFRDDILRGLEQKLPIPGELISACGKVGSYKDVLQLEIQDPGDLRVVGVPGK